MSPRKREGLVLISVSLAAIFVMPAIAQALDHIPPLFQDAIYFTSFPATVFLLMGIYRLLTKGEPQPKPLSSLDWAAYSFGIGISLLAGSFVMFVNTHGAHLSYPQAGDAVGAVSATALEMFAVVAIICAAMRLKNYGGGVFFFGGIGLALYAFYNLFRAANPSG